VAALSFGPIVRCVLTGQRHPDGRRGHRRGPLVLRGPIPAPAAHLPTCACGTVQADRTSSRGCSGRCWAAHLPPRTPFGPHTVPVSCREAPAARRGDTCPEPHTCTPFGPRSPGPPGRHLPRTAGAGDGLQRTAGAVQVGAGDGLRFGAGVAGGARGCGVGEDRSCRGCEILRASASTANSREWNGAQDDVKAASRGRHFSGCASEPRALSARMWDVEVGFFGGAQGPSCPRRPSTCGLPALCRRHTWAGVPGAKRTGRRPRTGASRPGRGGGWRNIARLPHLPREPTPVRREPKPHSVFRRVAGQEVRGGRGGVAAPSSSYRSPSPGGTTTSCRFQASAGGGAEVGASGIPPNSSGECFDSLGWRLPSWNPMTPARPRLTAWPW